MTTCECGAKRTVSDSGAMPMHPDMRHATRGVFRWCEYGDSSQALWNSERGWIA